MSEPLSDPLAALRPLARRHPTVDAAVAEIARLSGELTLPRGAIHVLSDVHGEDVKLRHVINNASGTLRPVVERLFGDGRPPGALRDFLSLVFYPAEMLARIEPTLTDAARLRAFAGDTLRDLFALIRVLARRYSLRHVAALFPPDYRDVFAELAGPRAGHDGAYGDTYLDGVLAALDRDGRALHLVRLAVHLVRDLAVEEVVVAGDCYDRGPRGDRLLDYLRHQPAVSFTWGNHDAAWIGASLGDEALIAQVLRISLRYRRLSQLEEGYGITLQPLEHLVRTVYADDPATSFVPHGSGLRETVTVARMHKAAAIMQFKLEGQTIARHPDWGMEHRRLLHRIDAAAGTVDIDGTRYPLRDTHFPTLAPADPYALSAEERRCMDRLRQSFWTSPVLREHMRFLVGQGAMWLTRDRHLVFHGCVPVDAQGTFLPFVVDGEPRRGRALFEALTRVVVRAVERPTEADRDILWYLWNGPCSPCFGKDRITTFERDLVADPVTHVETKNPYFALINDAGFCERVLAEFGVDPREGLIVNGHVPVRLEAGESPMKRSGKAITIDGAFSEAYGDHGFTLVIDADRTFLARHHHFESVEAAVRDGVDIIPTISVVRAWDPPRRVADGERGAELRADVALLEQLVDAYRSNALRQA